MVRKSPALLKRIKTLTHELTSEAFNDGVFKPLASDSDTLDGLNVHGVLMDEIHQWKDGRALYNIMADGTTAREQPLVFITSTAGTVREDIYDDRYEYAARIINGYGDPKGAHDPHFIAFVYELDARLRYLLEEPNPYMTGQKLQEKLAAQLVLNNNAFALIIRDENGLPVEIYPITASSVQAIYRPGICSHWSKRRSDGAEVRARR